jgi:DNA-binding transcriptional LysR family regulator
MTNIPTELLRTLVAVVDLRSFTKAAQSLGVTQPAVSAQVKRLQILLGGELFDKSAPGVTLTEKGEIVVNYARRLLSINDQILLLAQPASPVPPVRIGLPGELDLPALPVALAELRQRWPTLRFTIRGQNSDNLLRDLRQGDLDLVVAFTHSAPTIEARHHWADDVVWVRGAHARLDQGLPLPLAAHDMTCVLNRVATAALNQAGRNWELVFNAPSAPSLTAAVAAGLGIAVAIRRFVGDGLVVCDDDALPKLPQVVCGIYLRDATDMEILAPLADAVARVIAPPASMQAAVSR